MWVFNVWLYLVFLANQPGYQTLVDAGMPCYGYAAQLADDPAAPVPPQPVCWYDPSNTNPGR
jgi:hypothetical protein